MKPHSEQELPRKCVGSGVVAQGCKKQVEEEMPAQEQEPSAGQGEGMWRTRINDEGLLTSQGQMEENIQERDGREMLTVYVVTHRIYNGCF